MTSLKILKTLIKDTDLLKFLSNDRNQILKDLQIEATDFHAKQFTLDNFLKNIHYSWFIPILENIKKKDVYLSFLNEKKINNYFQKTCDKKFSPWIQFFFKKKLIEHLLQKNRSPLPMQYLNKTDLTLLLDFPKNILIKIIDFLSLFDLSMEIQKIIDPTITKKIYTFLSKEQKKFLATLTNYREPFTFSKMNLPLLLKDKKNFQKTLHKKGLYRFSKALCMQEEDLIFYICHKLDIGRGSYLYKLCQQKSKKSISSKIEENIIKIIHTLELI